MSSVELPGNNQHISYKTIVENYSEDPVTGRMRPIRPSPGIRDIWHYTRQHPEILKQSGQPADGINLLQYHLVEDSESSSGVEMTQVRASEDRVRRTFIQTLADGAAQIFQQEDPVEFPGQTQQMSLSQDDRDKYEQGYIKIGSVWLALPPEAIRINTDNEIIAHRLLRSPGSLAERSGYAKTEIDVVLKVTYQQFNETIQPALAQFSTCPFLPVINRDLDLKLRTEGKFQERLDEQSSQNIRELVQVQDLIEQRIENLRRLIDNPEIAEDYILQITSISQALVGFSRDQRQDLEDILGELRRNLRYKIGDTPLLERILGLASSNSGELHKIIDKAHPGSNPEERRQIFLEVLSDMARLLRLHEERALRLGSLYTFRKMEDIWLALSSFSATPDPNSSDCIHVHLNLRVFNYLPYTDRLFFRGSDGHKDIPVLQPEDSPHFQRLWRSLIDSSAHRIYENHLNPFLFVRLPVDMMSTAKTRITLMKRTVDRFEGQTSTEQVTGASVVIDNPPVEGIEYSYSADFVEMPIVGEYYPILQWMGSGTASARLTITTQDEQIIDRVKELDKTLAALARQVQEVGKSYYLVIEDPFLNACGMYSVEIGEIEDISAGVDGTWQLRMTLHQVTPKLQESHMTSRPPSEVDGIGALTWILENRTPKPTLTQLIERLMDLSTVPFSRQRSALASSAALTGAITPELLTEPIRRFDPWTQDNQPYLPPNRRIREILARIEGGTQEDFLNISLADAAERLIRAHQRVREALSRSFGFSDDPSRLPASTLPENPVIESHIGTITRVIDGDTVVAQVGDQEFRIRIFGVDAPELENPDRGAQVHAQEATDFLKEWIEGKQVQIHGREWDDFDRLVADITIEGQNVARSLIERGLGWWNRRFAPGSQDLQRAEESARSRREGIFQDSDPIAPWNFKTGVALEIQDELAALVDSILDPVLQAATANLHILPRELQKFLAGHNMALLFEDWEDLNLYPDFPRWKVEGSGTQPIPVYNPTLLRMERRSGGYHDPFHVLYTGHPDTQAGISTTARSVARHIAEAYLGETAREERKRYPITDIYVDETNSEDQLGPVESTPFSNIPSGKHTDELMKELDVSILPFRSLDFNNLGTVQPGSLEFNQQTFHRATQQSELSWKGVAGAMPTFWLAFIERDNNTFGMFDDFYAYQAVESVSIVRSKNSPMDVVYVSLSNIYGNLGGRFTPNRRWHEEHNAATAQTRLEQPDLERGMFPLQVGTPVVLKMGYGNSVKALPTVFVGQVAEITEGPIIELVLQSYGSQLLIPLHYSQHDEKIFVRNKSHREIVEAMLQSETAPHFGRFELDWIEKILFGDPTAPKVSDPFHGVHLRKSIRTGEYDLPEDWSMRSRRARRFSSGVEDVNVYLPVRRHTLTSGPTLFESASKGLTWPATILFGSSERDLGQQTAIESPETGLVFRRYPGFIQAGRTAWDIIKEVCLDNPGVVAGVRPFDTRVTLFMGLPDLEYYNSSRALAASNIRSLLAYGEQLPEHADMRDIDRIYDTPKVPFRNYHVAKSGHNLVANNLEITENIYTHVAMGFQANRISKSLTKGARHVHIRQHAPGGVLSSGINSIVDDTAMATFTDFLPTDELEIMLDPNIPPEFWRVVYTQKRNVTTYDRAARYLVSMLSETVSRAYMGSIFMRSDRDIWPHDIIIISDDVSQMYGAIEVDEVILHFDRQLGYVYEIKPNAVVHANDYGFQSVAARLYHDLGFISAQEGFRLGRRHLSSALTNYDTLDPGGRSFGGSPGRAIMHTWRRLPFTADVKIDALSFGQTQRDLSDPTILDRILDHTPILNQYGGTVSGRQMTFMERYQIVVMLNNPISIFPLFYKGRTWWPFNHRGFPADRFDVRVASQGTGISQTLQEVGFRELLSHSVKKIPIAFKDIKQQLRQQAGK